MSRKLRTTFRASKRVAVAKSARDDELRDRYGLDSALDLGSEDVGGDEEGMREEWAEWEREKKKRKTTAEREKKAEEGMDESREKASSAAGSSRRDRLPTSGPSAPLESSSISATTTQAGLSSTKKPKTGPDLNALASRVLSATARQRHGADPFASSPSLSSTASKMPIAGGVRPLNGIKRATTGTGSSRGLGSAAAASADAGVASLVDGYGSD